MSPFNVVSNDLRKLAQIIVDLGAVSPDPSIQSFCERRARRILERYKIKKRLQPKWRSI